jgi:hypothetical protein
VGERLDRGPRLRDLLERQVVDPDPGAVPCHRHDLGRAQRADADDHLVLLIHAFIPPRCTVIRQQRHALSVSHLRHRDGPPAT